MAMVERETRLRSIAKTLSYRFAGTMATAGLALVLTRELRLAALLGGLDAIVKSILYYAHERAWHRVRFGKRRVEPAVIWFTGLPGSGKSTIAQSVRAELDRRGLPVDYLDGDEIRASFPETGFTREERDAHIRRVGHLASRLERHGVFVVCSLVSPYKESRAFVRGLCRNFVEVYVATPLDECERRDPKGLYARARRGEIQNFTGIDDPYEPPERAEVVIDTKEMPVEAAAKRVLAALKA
jgi:adenylylsulfate kinase